MKKRELERQINDLREEAETLRARVALLEADRCVYPQQYYWPPNSPWYEPWYGPLWPPVWHGSSGVPCNIPSVWIGDLVEVNGDTVTSFPIDTQFSYTDVTG